MFLQYKRGGRAFKFPHNSRWWNDSTANENLFNDCQLLSSQQLQDPQKSSFLSASGQMTITLLQQEVQRKCCPFLQVLPLTEQVNGC